MSIPEYYRIESRLAAILEELDEIRSFVYDKSFDIEWPIAVTCADVEADRVHELLQMVREQLKYNVRLAKEFMKGTQE